MAGAAAGWAVFLWRANQKLPLMIACGGVLLAKVSSDEAELAALELGVRAFSSLIEGQIFLIPHVHELLTQSSLSRLKRHAKGNYTMY